VDLVYQRIYKQFVYGLQKFGDMLVYTSSGAGTWGPPLRVCSHPEIVLILFRVRNAPQIAECSCRESSRSVLSCCTNASKSALIWSALVVGIPCESPDKLQRRVLEQFCGH